MLTTLCGVRYRHGRPSTHGRHGWWATWFEAPSFSVISILLSPYNSNWLVAYKQEVWAGHLRKAAWDLLVRQLCVAHRKQCA